MQEKVISRNGEEVIEVRSDAGKLLYVKTREGYELKCPRSKQICLIRYHEMVSDCLKCLPAEELPGILDMVRSRAGIWQPGWCWA